MRLEFFKSERGLGTGYTTNKLCERYRPRTHDSTTHLHNPAPPLATSTQQRPAKVRTRWSLRRPNNARTTDSWGRAENARMLGETSRSPKKNKSGKLRICLTMLGIEFNFESIKTRLGATDQGRTEQIAPALWIECEPT